MCVRVAQNKHKSPSSMHHPLPGNHPMKPHDTPSTTPWSEQQTFVVVLVVTCYFHVVTPTGLFSNLRTACSETLMLRERNASMADRSLSSLTGELLLLATAAVAFTTFAARRLSGDGELRGKAGRPRVGINMAVVWECGARECVMCGDGRRYHHPSTRPTWAGDQRSQATQRRGRVQRVGPQRWKGISHMEREGPGAMQEGSRKTPTSPNTTTTTQHQTAGGRRGVKWRIERNKKQRWKLTEVNHINQITREGSRNEKRQKHQLNGKLLQKINVLWQLQKKIYQNTSRRHKINGILQIQVQRKAKD